MHMRYHSPYTSPHYRSDLVSTPMLVIHTCAPPPPRGRSQPKQVPFPSSSHDTSPFSNNTEHTAALPHSDLSSSQLRPQGFDLLLPPLRPSRGHQSHCNSSRQGHPVCVTAGTSSPLTQPMFPSKLRSEHNSEQAIPAAPGMARGSCTAARALI